MTLSFKERMAKARAEKGPVLPKAPRKKITFDELSSEVKGSLATMSDKLAKFMENAYLGNASPKKAIKAKCFDCVCHEEPISRIRDCKSYICPLHKYRPYKQDGES